MSQGLSSSCYTCLVFITGFGAALVLQNRLPAIYNSTAAFWLLTYRAWVVGPISGLTSYVAVVICVTVGFIFWALHFRPSASQGKLPKGKYPMRSRCPTDETTLASRTRPVRPLSSTHSLSQVDRVYVDVTAHHIAKGVTLHSFPGSVRKVVKIDPSQVVKLGPDINMTEAESMRFIRNNTTIPVPRVLKAYTKEGCGYILMEFVEGELLEKVWPKLRSDERRVILAELKDYVRQMRQIPCPDGTLIGSVTGGPAVDRRQLNSIMGGPFTSEVEFNEWQLAQLQPQTSLRHRDLYAGTHKTDHQIVFSHCDLAFHNIIVKGGHIAAIIDWEDSGWYPEHWDYCKTIPFLSGTDELYAFGKEIFEKSYHFELLMDTWFTREVRHGGF